MKRTLLHSKPGKAAAYVKKVALDLVKARRQSGNAEKVCLDVLLATDKCMTLCLRNGQCSNMSIVILTAFNQSVVAVYTKTNAKCYQHAVQRPPSTYD